MYRIKYLLLLALFLFCMQIQVFAQTPMGGTSASLIISDLPDKEIQEDNRSIKLRIFLESVDSPLAPYADVFVKQADKYGLPDWRLVPAITGVESTFGKQIPFNSFNAYGWCNGNCSFASWEQSIEIVTKTLKEKYYDRGITTIEEIAHIYAPPSTTWNFKVNNFIDKIEKTDPVVVDYLPLSI
jgi:hypothetical protein